MRRTWPSFACALAVFAGLAAIVLPDADARAHSCLPHGARNVYSAPTGRVYSKPSRSGFPARIHYVCLFSTGRSYRLERPGGPNSVDERPLALVGKYVAFADREQGVDTSLETVYVLNASNGSVRHHHAAAVKDFVEGGDTVRAIVLKRDGSVAWSVHSSSFVSRGSDREICKLDLAGFRELDHGARVALDSLRLHRSRLSWRNGTRLRHATLA